MALRLSTASSSETNKLLSEVHVTDGSIVQLFKVNGEDGLKQLATGLKIKTAWKWMRNSIVFGTLTDSGVIQIWDLLTSRAIIKLQIKEALNCLSANFLIEPDGNPFLFLKDKFRLYFKELTEPTSSLQQLKSVEGIDHVVGFCTPKVHKNYLIYPTGSNGIVAIGFSRHKYAISCEKISCGLISKLVLAPYLNHGMIVILNVVADWLVIIYEDGHIEIFDLERGQEIFNYELKNHYEDEEDKSVVPMPMACDGRADLGRVVIAVAGVNPRLFVLDIRATSEIFSVSLSPTIIRVDGCSDLSIYPDSRSDLLAISSLSGSVDLYKLSSLTHLANVPHREEIIKHVTFISKSSESQETMLLCASKSNLSLWSLPEYEDDAPADCENSYDACLLDLPIVYNVLKVDQISIRRKTVINRKPRLVHEAGDTIDGLSAQLESLNFNTAKEKKRKRHTKLYKMNQNFIAQAKQITEATLKSLSITKTKGSPADDKSAQLFDEMCKLAVWISGLNGVENKNHILERWENLRSQPVSSPKRLKSTISKLLNLDKGRLDRFDFFRDPDLIDTIRNADCSNWIFPDLLKMVALSLWQRSEMKKCLYYLTAVHGSFLRTDILDKHSAVLVSDEEMIAYKAEKNEKDGLNLIEATIKQKLYGDHMKSLKAFDDASAFDFQKRLNELNPDWSIVQITSIFHYQNRFHTDVVASQETPAIFLSCFATPYGSQERGSFLAYIPEPVKNPGVSKCGLLEQFSQLMIENRAISSQKLELREYWQTRAVHNRKLMTILAAIEENWLFPWSFILGGNLVEKDLQDQIVKTIHQIETVLKKQLTSTQIMLLMKLIGNFNTLPQLMKNSIGRFISVILDTSKTCKGSVLSRIADSVIKVGTGIPLTANRHPCIFVLDQEIEQIPWEWLTCTRSTSATRIQSLPLLYTSMKLVENRLPIDPKKCFFVLNPDQSLANVQTRLEKYFTSRKEWNGIAGAIPAQKSVDEVLQKQDIYLYCGHGSGQCVYPDHALHKITCNAVPLLMGCASVQYKCTGSKSYADSVLNSYTIAMCPSIVGFLWGVTDVECDRITVDLLERWIPAPRGTQLPEMGGFDAKSQRPTTTCLATAVRLSRSAATQFMTQAAIVNYGIPVYARSSSEEIPN